jgi:dephospho-CoA kinase
VFNLAALCALSGADFGGFPVQARAASSGRESRQVRSTTLARQRARPYVVGLTGGIGSGKTTVAKLFETLGAGLVDTDEIAHELTRPGAAALERIRRRFGDEVITGQGTLDRARLRALVFRDPAARRDLEAILHPLIRAEATERLRANAASYVILVVPLLIETGAWSDLLQRVVVVDCDEAVQLQRTMARSGLTADEVRAIMATQAGRAQRLAAADDVILNDAGLAELGEQVRRLHARYVALASAGRAGGTTG